MVCIVLKVVGLSAASSNILLEGIQDSELLDLPVDFQVRAKS